MDEDESVDIKLQTQDIKGKQPFLRNLLKVQIGPVQQFIAQARSTRDLWSGSYLLSWLMASGISKLVREMALVANRQPSDCLDAVVYPDLQGQPLVTRRLAVDTGQTVDPNAENNAVLTPNLPNLLVAVLKADQATATKIAQSVKEAIRHEWKAIANQCWERAQQADILTLAEKPRFNAQIERFLSIYWQVTPFEPVQYARDYNKNAWQLDAVRQTREFQGWRSGGWEIGVEMNKDTLTGREEALLGGSEWWQLDHPRMNKLWPILLRRKHEGDRLGAVTLVKRIWHWAYLNDPKWKLKPLHISESDPRPTHFPFPSTFQIAQHDPTKTESDDKPEQGEDSDRLSRYFVVLALDGDQIGKWIGGQFHELTDMFHRDFSRRLGNFALHCVRPIVVACDGRLIYAGGDDVLALVPADTVFACASFLRQAYRGDAGFLAQMTELSRRLVDNHREQQRRFPIGDAEEIAPMLINSAGGEMFEARDGRLALHGSDSALDLPGEIEGRNQDGQTIRPDASVGIAVAHFKTPLQDVVRAAQAAEKRAKRKLDQAGLDRSAVAVTIYKRSGETVEWGCKWDGGGLKLYRTVASALADEKLSAGFPHRLVELLQPYLTASTPLMGARGSVKSVEGFNATEVIRHEFAHTLDRQRGKAYPSGEERDQFYGQMTTALNNYLESLKECPVDQKLRAIIGLCQTVAFTPAQHFTNDAEPKGTP